MNVNIKTEYILFAVIIIVAIMGVLGREWVHNRKIDELNEQNEQLIETANIQKAQIDEMTARFQAAQAEIESMNKYSQNVETILHDSKDLSHEIYETVCNDEESRDWYQSSVPDDIYNILHERLCNDKSNGVHKN